MLFFKKVAYFLTVSFVSFFLFVNKTLQLNNEKTRSALNVTFSVFVICTEAIIYLAFYNLHEHNFNENLMDCVNITKRSEVAKSFL